MRLQIWNIILTEIYIFFHVQTQHEWCYICTWKVEQHMHEFYYIGIRKQEELES